MSIRELSEPGSRRGGGKAADDLKDMSLKDGSAAVNMNTEANLYLKTEAPKGGKAAVTLEAKFRKAAKLNDMKM